MSFEQPTMLWGLTALIPVAAILFRSYILGLRDIRSLLPEQDRYQVERVLRVKWTISASATLLMFASLVVALAEPVWGEEDISSNRSQLDISVLFDVSRSMYADDVEPSRLEASRDAVSSLVERLPDSRVGLTVFRGGATRVLPVTDDRIALDYVLSTAAPGMITSPGTDIGEGIRQAIEALPAGSNRHGAVLLVSDGDDLSEEAVSAAEHSAGMGVPVFVIGVGSLDGTAIRLPDGERIRDAEGEVVVSSLDEDRLRQIAEMTRGVYVNLSETDALTVVEERLLALEEGSKAYRVRPKPRYSVFSWFAISFAIIAVVVRIVRWRDMF